MTPGEAGAAVGVRQDRAGSVRHQAGRRRCRDRLLGRHRRRPRRRRAPGHSGDRGDRHPGDARRAGQDAAPGNPRRDPRRRVRRPEHVADLDAHGVEPFQLVVVDLYPFEATVADPEVAEPAAVEQIDIGGPTMIRAAAKNHANVAVVTSPGDYEAVASMPSRPGGSTPPPGGGWRRPPSPAPRGYDAAILDWLHRDEPLPPSLVIALDRVDVLRYGENPHQEAAVYRDRGRDGVVGRRRAGPGEATLVQQPDRRGGGVAARRPTGRRRGGGGDRQAHQPVRRRGPAGRRRRLRRRLGMRPVVGVRGGGGGHAVRWTKRPRR